ncbi:peptidoglycan-binding protein LysM [Ketobacter sp. MCCC 1A13808]|jgi:nucleoid-associated protein YgaU|uniref:peptidoglycan-binding protein LysM n=1 Tax=Ketobacter sp. MCCC 1A13808 TaxID=2602738 RepID=UPI000F1D0C2B|nr:peptidoglycan-binding protein LysM [Ketobacter sp. MCCC 1A13808]MVF11814.1 peptidoglycan-binding protein LysM [Ketobacter sp. MCCC 1A13808]RLP55418.1 MAG: peptidoglycan-binding protein LysM [Ketobacter sp.]
MGLFSFVREAGGALGSKVYDLTHGDEDLNKPVTITPERMNELRKANIERSVAELNLGADPFSADVDGEKVVLTGSVPSQEVSEKVTLVAGNQNGISQVDCQLQVAEAAATDSPVSTESAQFYTVKAGDTLSQIAKETLGQANYYMKIFEANKPMLSDPDKIYVGQSLRIPQE